MSPAPRVHLQMSQVQQILTAARYSRFAYMHPEELWKEWRKQAFPFQGATKPLLISSQRTDTQAYMWRNPRGDVHLAFRGTTTWREAMADLQMYATSYGPHGCKIHSGFAQQWLSVRDNVMGQIQSWKMHNGHTQVSICGHSMGGALAQLSAAELASIDPDLRIVCITFGSPRVGNTQFVSWLERGTHENWRILNHKDPVPHVLLHPVWVHSSSRSVALGPTVHPRILSQNDPEHVLSRTLQLLTSFDVADHSCDLYIDRLSEIKDMNPWTFEIGGIHLWEPEPPGIKFLL